MQIAMLTFLLPEFLDFCRKKLPAKSFMQRGPGAAQKIMCPHAFWRARNRTHFRQGSRARLRALEAPGLF